MDITSRKLSKIISLNEHFSTTVRDIAKAAGKSSVSRILGGFQVLGTSPLKRKGRFLQDNRAINLIGYPPKGDSRNYIHPPPKSRDVPLRINSETLESALSLLFAVKM
ncbi:hypothetical protein TNCV_1199121 [Trichonephila clavipes]|uniref:Uncharacterized protein n=1 Tax=Trichonephila clavipes TaxID=2585209 RepID=A0A8X6VE60_TRICX|nr:hypothetical protein TNCV_1199121 [Trichonephila clavipes]